MVPATRLAEKMALSRVLGEVCNLEDDSNIHKACEHESILNMNALIGFTALEIEDINYMDGTVHTKLNKGHKGIIYALQSMAIYCRSINDAIPEDWNGITREDFNEYRSSLGFLTARAGLPQQPLHPPLSGQETLSLISRRESGETLTYLSCSNKTNNGTHGTLALLPKLGPKVCQIFFIRILFL
jgi:hypothetical protein